MDALVELEQTLRTKQGGLTPPEVSILLSCRSKAVNSFTTGACVASALVWATTRRLDKMFRFNLSAGSAVSFGLWRFSRSLDSCLAHIMALDGSRMQKELATIIVNKYQDNPWRMQLISNHFYSEKVFDDSTSDKPKLRWRHRNFFGDSASHNQGTHDDDDDDHVIDSQNDNHSYKNDLESKQVHVKPGIDMMADPLDCLLEAAAGGEIHPDSISTSHRIHTRSHKRSHRRRRMRHQEASSELSESH
ncbi:hypothetical protein AAG906_024803 [Vitis piasezkii]